jgi:ketosteroid isomerase-like protein
MTPTHTRVPFLAGVATAVAARVLLVRAVKASFDRDVARLNAGDHRSLLRRYAPDAVLRFNEGDHRWSGVHRGRDAIGRFLEHYTGAKVQGEIRSIWLAGAPWALRMVARFDDRADGPDGRRLYANRTAIVIRTRWGRIVEHDDFYEDTQRIVGFERELRALEAGEAGAAGARAAAAAAGQADGSAVSDAPLPANALPGASR